MQNMTPFGGARGTVEVTVGGNGPMLETGKRSEVCRMLKLLPLGPNGEKGVIWWSEPITQVPFESCEVVINRGAGRVLEAILVGIRL